MPIPSSDPAVPTAALALLHRHAVRRAAGTPTVGVLVGPLAAGRRAWEVWTRAASLAIVVARAVIPRLGWLTAAAEGASLPALAVTTAAARAGREPSRMLAEWRSKAAGDRERFWDLLAPHADDDILRTLAGFVADEPPAVVAGALVVFGERAVELLARLLPPAGLPGVLVVTGSEGELECVADEMAAWALRSPGVPLAVTATAAAWAGYLASAPDGRAKALVREGEVIVPAVAGAERALVEAGMTAAAAATLSVSGIDPTLITAAGGMAAVAAPDSPEAEGLARSRAEAALYALLESMPETAGRFEPNATLDFRFGQRPIEVDLLCRRPRVAVEIDGYFHFLSPDAYRRDRAKDWELQRRGYVVLRFLADDVLTRFETIRDRIFLAVADPATGGAA